MADKADMAAISKTHKAAIKIKYRNIYIFDQFSFKI